MSPSTATVTRLQDMIDLVAHCAATQSPIVDYGVAHRGLGHDPPAEHIRVDDQGVDIEHYERDLTVRAWAGTTLGCLQDHVREAGQFLPIDVDHDLTLREVVAHHVYGALRARYGGVRELLLGLGVVDGHARQIRAGGRTVKNVAGYDLTRLMVGSLGELGFIHEVVLRTYVIPEMVMAVEMQVHDPVQLDATLTPWLIGEAAADQMAMVMRGPAAQLHVGYYGTMSAVTARLRTLEALVDTVRGMKIMNVSPCDLDEDIARRSDRRAWRRSVAALVKLVVPPASTGATCSQLSRFATENRFKVEIEAFPVHGCIFVGGDLTSDESRRLSTHIQRLVVPLNGVWVWYALPTGSSRTCPQPPASPSRSAANGERDRRDEGDPIPRFGPPQLDWPILVSIKRAFDPHGLMNPERFLPVTGL